MDGPPDNREGDGAPRLWHLLETLPPDRQAALEHATRRRLLRRLNEAGTALTTSQLRRAIGEPDLSSISYHARVLERCGLARRSGPAPTWPEQGHGFESCVAEDARVGAVLAATRTGDGDAG